MCADNRPTYSSTLGSRAHLYSDYSVYSVYSDYSIYTDYSGYSDYIVCSDYKDVQHPDNPHSTSIAAPMIPRQRRQESNPWPMIIRDE
jgi:hypothetical protein